MALLCAPNRITVECGVFYAVRVVSNTEYVMKESRRSVIPQNYLCVILQFWHYPDYVALNVELKRIRN
jgi:hypothetical protein